MPPHIKTGENLFAQYLTEVEHYRPSEPRAFILLGSRKQAAAKVRHMKGKNWCRRIDV